MGLVVSSARGQGLIDRAASIDGLLSLNPNFFDFVGVQGMAGATAADGGFFVYDPNSSAATNATTVFKPHAYGGRWLRLTPATGVAGSGTVSSVGVSVGAGLTVSGSPITTSGTIDLALASGLHWDAANSRLGVNNSSPARSLHLGGELETGGSIFMSNGSGLLARNSSNSLWMPLVSTSQADNNIIFGFHHESNLEFWPGTELRMSVDAGGDVTVHALSANQYVKTGANKEFVSSATVAAGDVFGVLSTANLPSANALDSELHAAVTLAGSRDYLTISGQEIERNPIDLATDVTGVLGTGNLPAANALDSELHSAVTLGGTLDYLTLSGQQIVRGAINLATDTAGALNAANIGVGTVSDTEFGRLDGVTSAIQTQLNGKAAATHGHSASDVTSGTFANARISQSSVTQHEAAVTVDASQVGSGVLPVTRGGTGSGTASGARNSLGVAIGSDVQAFDSDLSALAGVSANGILARTGAGAAAARSIAAGSSKVTVSNANGVTGNPTIDVSEADLGLNNLGGTLSVLKGGTGANSASGARTALGLEIGSNVQAFAASLADIALLTPTKGRIIAGNGTDWVVLAAGADGEALTIDSGEATGLSWASVGGVSSVGVSGDASISVSGSPITSSGTIALNADPDLDAIATLGSTGIVVRTASGSMTTRSIGVGSNRLSLHNDNGVSGNPTLDVNEANLDVSNMGGATVEVSTAIISDDAIANFGRSVTIQPGFGGRPGVVRIQNNDTNTGGLDITLGTSSATNGDIITFILDTNASGSDGVSIVESTTALLDTTHWSFINMDSDTLTVVFLSYLGKWVQISSSFNGS